MKQFVLFAFLIISSAHVFAQEDLFGKSTETQKANIREGWLIGLNGNFDLPAADMAKRFGTSYRVGPSVLYKTNKNLIFGVKADFILGNHIKEDSLMYNLRDRFGTMLDQSGNRVSPKTFERGYMIGVSAGKIFSTNKNNKDNGIMVLGTIGFMQHKIKLNNKDNNNIAQIHGDYAKGYDRLTNGMFVEGYAGYAYFAKDGLLNFTIGLDIAAGFTQGRRDYQFDMMRPDNQSRTDILVGIRGSWYIPIFKHKSEEYTFD